jgi:hypothetical protein
VESSKKGGRTKGTPNKVTAKIKERLTDVLSNEVESLQLTGLSAKDKIELIKALLPYILPKLQSTYIETDKEPTEIKPITIKWIQ